MTHPHPSVADRYQVGGTRVEHVQQALAQTKPDNSIVPLLVGADVLPQEFLGSKLLPAVYYGADPYRHLPGTIDIMPASATSLEEQLGNDYFSPHNAVKAAAYKELKRQRGESFVYSSYLLAGRGCIHLFTEVPQEDEPRRQPEVVSKLAAVYNLGSITVRNEVLVGSLNANLPRPGLPAIISEIGQTIFGLDYSQRLKTNLVREVVKELEANRSPDYRRLRRR